MKNFQKILFAVVVVDLIINLLWDKEVSNTIVASLKYLYLAGVILALLTILKAKSWRKDSEHLEMNRRTIFKNLPCTLKVISPKYEILMMNREGTRMTGFPETAVLGKKCYDVFGNKEICQGCPVPSAIESKTVCTTHKHSWSVQGTAVYVEQTAIPILDGDGEVEYVLESALDITEKEELENKFNSMFVETVSSFASLVGSRDHSTGSHSKRVNHIGVMIGRQLRLPDSIIEEISISALLHDIGKIGISENVLNKKGKLTPAEYAEIQQHCAIGYDALKGIEPLREIADYVRYHHEAFDGSGYPLGLKGKDIPLVSRILSVADVFEALTADRVYRKAMDFNQALAIMKSGRGIKFDPTVLDAFLACVGERRQQSKLGVKGSCDIALFEKAVHY